MRVRKLSGSEDTIQLGVIRLAELLSLYCLLSVKVRVKTIYILEILLKCLIGTIIIL